jgi:hypothetical protein
MLLCILNVVKQSRLDTKAVNRNGITCQSTTIFSASYYLDIESGR